MQLEITFKNGKIHVYSVEDYTLDSDHNLLEIYSWYFPSHAKSFKLTGISKIIKFYIYRDQVIDKVNVYELY